MGGRRGKDDRGGWEAISRVGVFYGFEVIVVGTDHETTVRIGEPFASDSRVFARNAASNMGACVNVDETRGERSVRNEPAPPRSAVWV